MNIKSFTFTLCTMMPFLFADAADNGDDKSFKIKFIRNYDVTTKLDQLEYQSEIRGMFSGEKVQFHLNNEEGFYKYEVLDMMRDVSVLYINTHSGESSDLQTQILKCRPASSGELIDQCIISNDIRKVVGDDGGPKLVIINGCHTTNFSSRISSHLNNRLATGFGIGPQAQGRAYLGWQKDLIEAMKADMYLKAFLKAWTTPGPTNRYPTLEQAHQQVGEYNKFSLRPFLKNNLVIVGDQDLRYDFVRGYIRNTPIRGVWKLEPPEDPRDLEDWGAIGALLLHLRFVVHGNGRLTAFYELQPGQKKYAKEVIQWRLDGDYSSPRLTLIESDAYGKRKQSKSFFLTIGSPGRIGIKDGDTNAWVVRVGDAS